jgi:hypothetical protein
MSKEEWELRERQKIVERWHRLATDLDVLVKGGTLDPEAKLAEIIKKLIEVGVEDVR